MSHATDLHALHAALRALGVDDDRLTRLRAALGDGDAAASAAPPEHGALLRLAGTPAQRVALARRFGWSFDALTRWVAQADLLRVEGMAPATARLLVAAGVMGAHDLAAFFRQVPVNAHARPSKDHTWLTRVRGLLARPFGLIALLGRSPNHPPTRYFDPDRGAEHLAAMIRAAAGTVDGAASTGMSAATGGMDAAVLQRHIKAAFDLTHPRRDTGRVQTASTAAAQSAARDAPRITTGTDAVVIVKGAGQQGPDASLGMFMRGFWPAMKATDPDAVVYSRRERGISGEVVEVLGGNRRIWLTEAYWEKDIRPPGPTTVFFAEWRAAVFAYVSMPVPHLKAVNGRRDAAWWRWLPLLFFVELAMVGAFGAIVVYFDRLRGRPLIDLPFVDAEARITATLITWLDLPPNQAPWVIPGLVLAVLAAYLGMRAWTHVRAIREQSRRWPGERPDVGTWTPYLMLLMAFLISPVWYVIGIIHLVAFNVVLQTVRDVAWPCRHDFGTDDDRLAASAYRDDGAGERGATTWRDLAARLVRGYWLPQWLYRYTAIVVLPLVSIVYALVRVLALVPASIPVVGSLSGRLSSLVGELISGSMGDITVYATDPAQAPRIRAAAIDAIHTLARRDDVDRIHVVAHSQGTPIAYETLYHHLPDADRAKVWSFVTIGSVLNYYHQIHTVLDRFSEHRFPVRADPGFPPQYRWVNLWNSGDPIPEFRSLEGFGSGIGDRGPTNVKVSAHRLPVASHTGYWTDVYDLHIPLARRLLGDLNPDEWSHPSPDAWRRAEQALGDGAPAAGAVAAGGPDATGRADFDLRHVPSKPWWRANGPRRPRGRLRLGHPLLTFGLWAAGLVLVFAGSHGATLAADACFGASDRCQRWVTASACRVVSALPSLGLDVGVWSPRVMHTRRWLLEKADGPVEPGGPAVLVHGPELLVLVLSVAALAALVLARAPLTALLTRLIYVSPPSDLPDEPEA